MGYRSPSRVSTGPLVPMPIPRSNARATPVSADHALNGISEIA